MSTNLLIRLKRKTDVILASDVNNPALSTLTLNLKEVIAWNNSAAVGTNGRVNTGFPIDGDLANNAKNFQIKQIEITGATNVLTTFHNLIFLKNSVKGTKVGAKNSLSFELVIDKDIGDSNVHWNISAGSTTGARDRILKLSAADFGGQMTTDKILINDVNYHAKNDNKTETVVFRDDQKQELLALERLVETMKTKYRNLLDFGRGPDVDLFVDSADLGNKPDPAANPPVAATGLWAYYFGTDPQVAKDPTNIKHILFDLKDNYNQKIYNLRALIKGLLAINEIIERGLTKKSHVFLMDSGSGYKFSDKLELDKEPGFYKGFPLIDPNLKATPDPTDDNKFRQLYIILHQNQKQEFYKELLYFINKI
ncbi:protein of unknown function [endosymbiont DhMRE of Dentiscutata heterogama]|uniref:hypothetical protein n=1 Tax=endosymbiont DhMRE of Dentiscutata heterogama TaxID=1609546 RepID=UPI000629D85F|nr:hypothetical protein [endosymbiont DhMRE of Dentiscutata heterogama]CFW93114.1 protein of unknown function [endosymbiont DhMRE of Dentiscutata heterogama]